MTYRFASAADFIAFRSEVSGSPFAAAGDLTAARRTDAEAVLLDALKRFETRSGALELTNACHCIAARRSETAAA